jgi:hypothetical protein
MPLAKHQSLALMAWLLPLESPSIPQRSCGMSLSTICQVLCAGVLAGQELVLCVENKTPKMQCFQFARVTDGLHRAGQYVLEYTVTPAPPGQVSWRGHVSWCVCPA